MSLDKSKIHDRVDEILNDHFPSMMGRNGVDVSLKEFAEQVADHAYAQGVLDGRETQVQAGGSDQVGTDELEARSGNEGQEG